MDLVWNALVFLHPLHHIPFLDDPCQSMMRIISASLTLQDTKIRIEQIIVFRTGYGTGITIEFLGMCERLNNPDFNPIEFDGFKKTVRVCWQISLAGVPFSVVVSRQKMQS